MYIEIVLHSSGYRIPREFIRVKDIINPDTDSLVSTRERAVEMHDEATIAGWTPYAAPTIAVLRLVHLMAAMPQGLRHDLGGPS